MKIFQKSLYRSSDPQKEHFKKILDYSRQSTPAQGLIRFLTELNGVDYVNLTIFDEKGKKINDRYSSATGIHYSNADINHIIPDKNLRDMLKSDAIEYITATSHKKWKKEVLEKSSFSELMIVPTQGEKLNVITVLGTKSDSPSLTSKKFFKLIDLLLRSSDWILELLLEHERVLKMTLKDDLTQAYNRRYLETQLEDVLSYARKTKLEVALIFFDLNDFRVTNDRYGHYFGSQILMQITKKIMEKVRELDRLVRFGGDEFCVLLPNTSNEGAMVVAERILESIKTTDFETPDGKQLNITACFGIASFPKDASDEKELICEADRAMYTAKAEGKFIQIINKEISKKMLKRHLDV